MPKRVRKSKSDDKKLYAFLATFLSIIGFIIALIARRDDNYVIFYAKQSLVIFIIGLFAGALKMIFMFIPIIGWIISASLTIIVIVAWVFSWIYALSGEKRDIPIVGDWAGKFDI